MNEQIIVSMCVDTASRSPLWLFEHKCDEGAIIVAEANSFAQMVEYWTLWARDGVEVRFEHEVPS